MKTIFQGNKLTARLDEKTNALGIIFLQPLDNSNDIFSCTSEIVDLLEKTQANSLHLCFIVNDLLDMGKCEVILRDIKDPHCRFIINIVMASKFLNEISYESRIYETTQKGIIADSKLIESIRDQYITQERMKDELLERQ